MMSILLFLCSSFLWWYGIFGWVNDVKVVILMLVLVIFSKFLLFSVMIGVFILFFYVFVVGWCFVSGCNCGEVIFIGVCVDLFWFFLEIILESLFDWDWRIVIILLVVFEKIFNCFFNKIGIGEYVVICVRLSIMYYFILICD